MTHGLSNDAGPFPENPFVLADPVSGEEEEDNGVNVSFWEPMDEACCPLSSMSQCHEHEGVESEVTELVGLFRGID